MGRERLAENIAFYRRKKGLSQEKLAEYMGVSRQAVTKWENGLSRPASGHLIRLAELLEVSPEVLLEGETEGGAAADQQNVPAGGAPWVLIGISVFCMLAYGIYSAFAGNFRPGVLTCMFFLCVPIQLFVHLYFSSAQRNGSFAGIAGMDDQADYDLQEVKRMLVQIDLRVGMLTTVFVFLLGAANCANLKMGRLNDCRNALLMFVYSVSFVLEILLINRRMAQRIYRREEDRRRAERGMSVTAVYAAALFAEIGMTIVLFAGKGIENNTLPALKAAGLLLLAVLTATLAYLREGSRIRKWDPAEGDYQMSRGGIAGLLLCLLLYGLMWTVG